MLERACLELSYLTYLRSLASLDFLERVTLAQHFVTLVLTALRLLTHYPLQLAPP